MRAKVVLKRPWWRERPLGTAMWREVEGGLNRRKVKAARREGNLKRKQRRQLRVVAIQNNIKATRRTEETTQNGVVMGEDAVIRRKQSGGIEVQRELKTKPEMATKYGATEWKMTSESAVTIAGCEEAIPEMTKLWSISGTKFKSGRCRNGHFTTRQTSVLWTSFVNVFKCCHSKSRYSATHGYSFKSCHDHLVLFVYCKDTDK